MNFHSFLLQKNSGHTLPCGSSSSHALNYSLSPTCGTASTWVHQPCTKLLRSRVTVDYLDRTAAVMPNEPSNHKTPSFPAVSWTDEATIISLFAESPSPSSSSRKATLASATVLLSQRREGKRIRDVGIFSFREKKELLQSSNRSSLSFFVSLSLLLCFPFSGLLVFSVS